MQTVVHTKISLCQCYGNVHVFWEDIEVALQNCMRLQLYIILQYTMLAVELPGSDLDTMAMGTVLLV